MSRKLIYILPLVILSLALAKEEIRLLEYPRNFPAPAYDFSQNPLDEAKVELGRALFYDPLLSRDSTISCATCHSPYNAFAHTDHDLSHGIRDQIGFRNAPALFNLAWQKIFMWDGAIHHLDVQALGPISDSTEMGEDLAHLTEKLQQHPRYPASFYQAFGDSTVTGEHLLKALAQFQLTLVSATAKYDSVQAGKAKYSPQENHGYQLFQQHCNSCHQEPLFTNGTFASNGLPVDTTLNDWGRYRVTQAPKDSLLFKVPTLRNLSYTYPYMHDGRFRKLNQVLKHYSEGIEPHPNLSPKLAKPLELSSPDRTDLVAFLRTLNDRAFVFDPAHQFPRNFFFPSEGSP